VAPCRGARLNPTQRYFHPLPLYIDFVFLKKIIFIYIGRGGEEALSRCGEELKSVVLTKIKTVEGLGNFN
jgi:hypothetical protein